jgi:hypothetical protein
MLLAFTLVGSQCLEICTTTYTVTEFLTPEQARQAYGTSETFSLVDPVTELFQDSHRCKLILTNRNRPKFNCVLLPGRFETVRHHLFDGNV